MSNPLRIYIGCDPRQIDGYRACVESLQAHASVPLDIIPLELNWLAKYGFYRRPTQVREGGQLWDVGSDAPMSTEFALTRFCIPALERHDVVQGHVLYCDCDFLFRADVAALFELAEVRCAVQVVKHEQPSDEGLKMDNRRQTAYARKNWSSLVLWNCAHGANQRMLGWDAVNSFSGLALQQFGWLKPWEIGELPLEWNWLEGVSPMLPEEPKAVHFTRGLPSVPGYEHSAYAAEWRARLAESRVVSTVPCNPASFATA